LEKSLKVKTFGVKTFFIFVFRPVERKKIWAGSRRNFWKSL